MRYGYSWRDFRDGEEIELDRLVEAHELGYHDGNTAACPKCEEEKS